MARSLSRYLFNIIFCTFTFIICALTLYPKPSVYAADVTLAWTANAEVNLAGYYIYYKSGSSGDPYNGTGVDKGDSPIRIPLDGLDGLSDRENPEFTLHGLSDTQATYIVLTAYSTEGNQSGYSNEVSFQPSIAPTLSSLSISGDSSVNENSNASYTATASFSDGSTQTVTSSTIWRDNSSYADISNSGVLSTSEISEDTSVTIQAAYAIGGITKTATKVVNIVNISAPVTFSDNKTQVITGNAVWSENASATAINSSGVLTASEVSEDTTVNAQASYATNGVTKTATKVITIVDVPPSNLAPDTPIIVTPEMGQTEVGIPLDIIAEPFSDPNNDGHIRSQWQISEQSDFSNRVVDITSNNYLTTFPVPHMVLKSNHQYYVRVRFFDAYSVASNWSDAVEFTTAFLVVDLNNNGIPDVDEVDNTVDFNLDGIPDIDQPQIIKCVRDYDGSASIGIEKASSSVEEIESLEVIYPDTISSTVNRPVDLIFGLFAYRLRVRAPGDTAIIRIYFSGDIFASDVFYKYDTINGWYDYSEHTTFNDDGQSITLEVKDGGFGDSDGLANGVIVDPGGIASGGSTYTGGSASTGGSGGGGGCFIATAAFGSKYENHLQLLRRFRDLYLMPYKIGRAFVNAYYRYSPPMANFIAEHDTLRTMVRCSLIPLLGLSWLLLHFGLVPTLLFLFLIGFTTLLCYRKITTS